MLKLGPLVPAIEALADQAAAEQLDRAERQGAAVRALRRLADDMPAWRARAETARTSWLVADPLERADTTLAIPAPPAEHRVVAADGSQIFVDRHAAWTGYLLNYGLVRLDYGAGAGAVLDSTAELRYGEAEVQRGEVGERRPIQPEEVGVERTLGEVRRLLELARQPSDRPVVALVDGTLIPWSWARDNPDDPQLRAYLDTLAEFEALGVPVAGYVSRSAAADLVHLVRVGLCDQHPVDCDACPHFGALTAELGGRRPITMAEAGRLPCGGPAGLTDADLLADVVRYGRRSAVFATRSRIYAREPRGRVAFAYLPVGDEWARLEFGTWILDEPARLDLLVGVVLDQAAKGRGYPVALAEAHEQAVVRAADRQALELLLERSLVRRAAPVSRSRKGRSKERPGV